MKIKNESGIALVGTLLILVLLAALLEGFILSINSDQELIGVDRGQTRAFYGALAGLEQLTGNLGTLFGSNYSPSVSQIDALTVDPPVIPGIQFVGPGGQSGYRIEYEVDNNGRTVAETRTIPSGPYEGLVGLITPYTMIATARTTPGGAEVQMRRSLQTVAVPVFQFGIFSETDLSFHSGPDFNFGGRVHTNGNLYLAQRAGGTLTLSDRVTALGEVIRKRLINGEPTSTTYYGTVKVSTAPSAYRNLALTEGSVVDGATSSHNEPTWTNLSRGTYNGNILNGRTGARRMDLPLVSAGAEPVDLIRRPAANEDASNRAVFDQRYYSMASLRILLSDTEADLTSLPTAVTATPPMRLAGVAPNGTYYATAGSYADGYRSAYDTPLIDGYIKIEMQDADHNWTDVTSEILNLGMTGRDTTGVCSDQANSILRVQRIKDSPSNCSNSNGRKYWPNVLYDAREGNFRDNVSTSQTTVYLGGVIHYIELDVANLASWLRSSDAINETGYVVYFSDRRTNRNTANEETGEYGFEDVVNSGNVATGLPDSSLELAEDVNENGELDYYGRIPILPDPPASPNTAAPLDSSARPQTAVAATIARVNKAIFFRRALKLVNGASFDLGSDDDGIPFGLAIASENPVYVQGNYNAPGTFSGTHRACSIIADAVTFLSRNWNDRASFTSPHNPSGRSALTTWYRTALIAGKSKPFTRITSVEDFGTDGGVHNFIRFLEDWSGQTLNYRGSIVSLFFNRQALGTYKCCTNVYSPPSRGYNFDVEFLQPRLLPPRTPVFRDINITSFSQVKRPH
jgi:hypothetical protein